MSQSSQVSLVIGGAAVIALLNVVVDLALLIACGNIASLLLARANRVSDPSSRPFQRRRPQ